MKIHLLLFALILTLQVAGAYSPASPYEHVVSNGRYFFAMLPAQGKVRDGKWIETKGPSGTAYRITQKGKFKKLWSIKGWYAFPGNVHLSSDGKSVALFRNQFLSQDGTIFADEKSNSILTIYHKGKLVAGFEAKDLMTDLEKGIVWTGWGPVIWQNRRLHKTQLNRSEKHTVSTETEGESPYVANPHVLQFATFERVLFLIDPKTGKILHRKPIPEEPKKQEPANSNDDPFAAETKEKPLEDPFAK